MKPAFSVILLTTLIGAGQGLFIALFGVEIYSSVTEYDRIDSQFYILGSLLSVILLLLGLLASFFHLGHPERAWRSAAMWRTSWLSREVIALPLTIVLISLYGFLHFQSSAGASAFGNSILELKLTHIVGVIASLAVITLFVCTAMIYACLKFLQEWASSLTVFNYLLLGLASGFTLMTVFASIHASAMTGILGVIAISITIVACVVRVLSLRRNARLRPRSSMQSAIGIKHEKIVQKSVGFMGGSFNTREFFHGVSRRMYRNIKWLFLILSFPIPMILISFGIANESIFWFAAAFFVQFFGLLLERWYFFAEANHPQNLYYQFIG